MTFISLLGQGLKVRGQGETIWQFVLRARIPELPVVTCHTGSHIQSWTYAVFTSYGTFLDQELIPCIALLILLFLSVRPLQKSPRLCRYKLDRDEIWQDCLSSKYASSDLVVVSISHHITFKMAAMTSFHAEKCCHLVSVHKTSVRCLYISVLCTSLSLSLSYSGACHVDVAASMSCCHVDLSQARRLVITWPKLSGRRSSSTVLNKVCFGLPVLRHQSLGGSWM